MWLAGESSGNSGDELVTVTDTTLITNTASTILAANIARRRAEVWRFCLTIDNGQECALANGNACAISALTFLT